MTAPAEEPCLIKDEGLSFKHALVPLVSKPGQGIRTGLLCYKCKKVWEWVNESPNHVRLV